MRSTEPLDCHTPGTGDIDLFKYQQFGHQELEDTALPITLTPVGEETLVGDCDIDLSPQVLSQSEAENESAILAVLGNPVARLYQPDADFENLIRELRNHNCDNPNLSHLSQCYAHFKSWITCTTCISATSSSLNMVQNGCFRDWCSRGTQEVRGSLHHTTNRHVRTQHFYVALKESVAHTSRHTKLDVNVRINNGI